MASNITIRSLQHVLQVCSNCKLRKKACDKAFPSCGYCTQRALLCRYTAPTSLPIAEEIIDSGKDAPLYREFVLCLNTPATTVANDMQSLRVSYPIIHSPLLADTVSFGKPAELLGLDGLFHNQVHHIIRATGQFVDDVTIRYFRGIHKWIPVISRRGFQNRLINSSFPASADLSLLLLCMCLITYRPSQVTSPLINRDAIYFTTKMLFTHVQAFMPPSLSLTQAGLLISIYEYAHGKFDTAHISITNCAKMFHEIGLRKNTSLQEPQDNKAGFSKEEERNTWWGIIIYERVIYCETVSANQPLTTKFPSKYDPLPSEAAILDQNDIDIPKAMTRLSTSAIDDGHIGSFGRQAQAAFLLDHVLHIINVVDLKTKLLELAKADKNLMMFLGILLEKSYRAQEHYCGSIAICIRALILLHGYLLDPALTGLEICQQTSLAALDTVSKMVIDIADYYNEHCYLVDIDPPPPNTFYIIQASLKHLDTNPCLKGDVCSGDYTALRKFSSNFYSRWNIV